MKNGELKYNYDTITALYDLAEELTATVESDFVQDPEAQIALVEPVISAIADSADILTQEFISIAEKPARKSTAKTRIESALRKIFIALEDYRAAIGLRSKKTLAALANIADPVVDKIRKQVEKVTLIFMQLLEISLDRIMNKHELDEFKRVNAQMVLSFQQIGH